MGVYDTFVNGKQDVQVKCFTSSMNCWKRGDQVPVRAFGFPASCQFRCFANTHAYAVVKRGRFVGIRKTPVKTLPVYSCGGDLVQNGLLPRLKKKK